VAQPDELNGVELWRAQCRLRRHQVNSPTEAVLNVLLDGLQRFHLKVAESTPGELHEMPPFSDTTWPKALDLRWTSPGDLRRYLTLRRTHILEDALPQRLGWPAGSRPNSDLWHMPGQMPPRQLGRVIMGTAHVGTAGECPVCHKLRDTEHEALGCLG
jgi:hypothetical protein